MSDGWEFVQDDADARRGVARILTSHNELVCEATPERADLIVCAVNYMTEAGEWLTPFEGSGAEWHEALPSPYTYQQNDFSKLVAAVHEYEAALIEARAALHRCREDYHAKVKALQRELADRA